MKCPNCQFETSSDSYFCPQCGKKIGLPDEGALSATRPMTIPPNRHQPGRLVGSKYKFLNIVGQGGMGVVFKAEDAKLRREVLVPALARDPRFGAILDRLRLNANSC